LIDRIDRGVTSVIREPFPYAILYSTTLHSVPSLVTLFTSVTAGHVVCYGRVVV
jgi:hypothetical protein